MGGTRQFGCAIRGEMSVGLVCGGVCATATYRGSAQIDPDY